MNVRATPVVKSVPTCMVPISVIAVGAISLVI